MLLGVAGGGGVTWTWNIQALSIDVCLWLLAPSPPSFHRFSSSFQPRRLDDLRIAKRQAPALTFEQPKTPPMTNHNSSDDIYEAHPHDDNGHAEE